MLRRVQPGTVLDGFRVESALHAGGNGYVYMVTPVAPRAYDIPLVMKVPGHRATSCAFSNGRRRARTQTSPIRQSHRNRSDKGNEQHRV
jgi:hypothetical protein